MSETKKKEPRKVCPFSETLECKDCRLHKARRHAENGECSIETIVYHLQGLDQFRGSS